MALPMNIPASIDSGIPDQFFHGLFATIFSSIFISLFFGVEDDKTHSDAQTETQNDKQIGKRTDNPFTLPVKAKRPKTQHYLSRVKNDVSDSFPLVKDLRVKPNSNDTVSDYTQTLITDYKDIFEQHSFQHTQQWLKDIASLYDVMCPNNILKTFQLNEQCISNHHTNVVAVYSAMRHLHTNDVILPHSDLDNSRVLIDVLYSTANGFTATNLSLREALLTEYATHKKNWSLVPASYVRACRLSREIQILTDEFIADLHANAFSTSWVDW